MKRAFTLIELLVVIAIIAILAAILFPVFAQAKEAAKATQVLSNQKQIALGQQMYINDCDDVLPAWFTRTGLPNTPTWTRSDLLSWVQQFDPYIKNGKPVLTAAQLAAAGSPTGYIPPTGLHFSPTWSETNWRKAAEQPDCDGVGGLPYVPQWTHSHYGMTVPFQSRGAGTGVYVGATAGTQADPDLYFAGSYYSSTPYPMNNSQITEVARTAMVTDGFTGVASNAGAVTFLTTMGCESASMYKGGGNIAFCDSHVKFVKGNNQRYLQQDSAGRWFMKYFTIDR